LEGAKVLSQIQPDGQLSVNGLTNQDGVVTFTNIKPGKYEFVISHSDFQTKVAAVDLAAGQPVAINITLEKIGAP
jgi:protocatechuate 3,4-dioxygenase beta subunit